jgi:hypothetical protein
MFPLANNQHTDFSGDNIAQKNLIIDALQRAYSPPVEGSDSPYGWKAVAHLVMYWLKHPDSVPQPPAMPLRGLVFIEEYGTIRPATTRDYEP